MFLLDTNFNLLLTTKGCPIVFLFHIAVLFTAGEYVDDTRSVNNRFATAPIFSFACLTSFKSFCGKSFFAVACIFLASLQIPKPYL